MVQRKAGASNNAWIKYQRECAKRYNEEKSTTPGAGGKAASKYRQASPSKAAKTREVNAEIRKEKAAAKKLAATATNTLARNTVAPKGSQGPIEKSRKARLAKHHQESRNAHNEATPQALATVQNRRREVRQPSETHQSVAPSTLAVRKRYRTKAP